MQVEEGENGKRYNKLWKLSKSQKGTAIKRAWGTCHNCRWIGRRRLMKERGSLTPVIIS